MTIVADAVDTFANDSILLHHVVRAPPVWQPAPLGPPPEDREHQSVIAERARLLPGLPEPDEPDHNDIERVVAETAAASAQDGYRLRRQRRAMVRRLIDFVRIEQLKLDGPNDHTSVEELTHDAVMKALDAYFEGRPTAKPDSAVSTSLETLEKMRSVGG